MILNDHAIMAAQILENAQVPTRNFGNDS